MGNCEIFNSCLLVEDDPGWVKQMKRDLPPYVNHLTVANSCAEARKIFFGDKEMDLVLCDLGLPDGSGVDLIRQFHEASPATPIIVTTVHHDLQNVVEAITAGAWDYLLKAYDDTYATRLKLPFKRAFELRLQKERELQLLEERNAFWAAAHTAQEGLGIITTTGEIKFANSSFRSLTRALGNNDDCQTFNFLQAVSNLDAKSGAHLELMLRGFEASPLWSTELKVPSQSENHKSTSSTDQLARHYKLVVTAAHAPNMTDSLTATEKLRFVVWLEDISEKKLREKFQRDLLATTVHDLKGPIGSVLTAVDLLSDKAVRPRLSLDDMLIRMSSCCRGALNLIDDLLSASRIQEQIMVIKPTKIDLPEYISEVVDNFQTVAQSKGVTLEFLEESCPAESFFDKRAMKRVLSNLISNAIKFTDSPGQVLVSAEIQDAELLIHVADTGTGIDPAQRNALFERYQRLDMHAQVEGTGLGLFVVKNIVDAHNGSIDVRSQLGIGSEFTVKLPLEQPEQPERASEHVPIITE